MPSFTRSFSRKKRYTLQNERTMGTSAGVGPAMPLSTRNKLKALKNSRASRGKVPKKKSKSYHGHSSQHRPLISTDSMMLHEFVPSIPMPNEPELNLLFAQMVV